ncbi:MAG: hypothetical protein ACRC4W_06180 [Treponemataceae bacterium]
MKCLRKLGWAISTSANKVSYCSNDGIEFDLPLNQKIWEYEIKYKKLLKILSFYFNITQRQVEECIVNAPSDIEPNDLVVTIKNNVIPYKGLRVYHGQSLFYNCVVILNYYLDKDNLIVVESMAFVKSNFKIEKQGTRIRYETYSIYDSDKDYKITSLCDSLDQAVKQLNNIYFEKFENKQNPADYDYFRQSSVLKEIDPEALIHVFGQSVADDINFPSKNAGFKEFQRYLSSHVNYACEVIE